MKDADNIQEIVSDFGNIFCILERILCAYIRSVHSTSTNHDIG